MALFDKFKNLNIKQKNKSLKGKSWRNCCALIILFVITFTVAIFALSIWHRYKEISTSGFATEVLNNKDIKTSNREFVESKDDPSWGNPNAPIVIVEFSDFECPFCKQMFPVLRELNLKYPEEIKFIYRDFLGHDGSQKAAEAAQCANEQGKFLMYHDKLFLNQDSLDINNLKIYARQIGIKDINKFDQCLDNNKFELEVKQDYKAAVKLGVEGTPTFFVNGIMIPGARSKEFFEQVIEYLLNNLEQ